MTEEMTRAALAAELGRAAEASKDAVAAHIQIARPGIAFQRRALFAIAALEGCAALAEPADSDIRLARDAASEAAGVCRTQKPDETIVAVAACLEDAARACRLALAETPPDKRPWKRFVFADADVAVARTQGCWHVRARRNEAKNKLLDIALEEVVTASNTRLAEMTVQILDWFTHDKLDP